MTNDTNPTVAILQHACDLVTAGWCQGKSAIDSHGGRVSPLDSEACAFCVSGAFDRSWIDLGLTLADDIAARRAFRTVTGWSSIINWNDTPGRPKADVVDAFARAIKLVLGR
jgi:hypothetical protein